MNHSFDVAVADVVGVNAAVLFQTIAFWCQHCEANDRNFHDGYYWTYSSIKGFSEIFSYLTAKQINTAIDKLLEAELIIKGNYNKSAYDRTAWYAVTEKGKCIFQKGKMEITKMANRNPEKGEPIPNTINNTINNTISRKRDVKVIPPGFDEFYQAYPRHASKAPACKAWAKLKPDDELRQRILSDVRRRVQGEWKGKDKQYIPHPSTYLNQRRWEDEIPEPELEKRGGLYYENLSPAEFNRLQEEAAERDREEARRQGLL